MEVGLGARDATIIHPAWDFREPGMGSASVARSSAGGRAGCGSGPCACVRAVCARVRVCADMCRNWDRVLALGPGHSGLTLAGSHPHQIRMSGPT